MDSKRGWLSKRLILFLIFLTSLALFSPSLNMFFVSDDWFHLRISQINSPGQFINFFSFLPTPQSASFYRPIPTQVFFFVFQSLFGLNPFPYRIFVFFVFSISLILVYKVSEKIFNERIGIVTLVLYSISATNFSRLYFLSAFQEIVMVTFLLSSIFFYFSNNKRHYFYSILFFILALGSKESAVVLPVILGLISYFKRELNRKLFPFLIISISFILIYFLNFRFQKEVGYSWDFSPKKALNTFFWYSIWSLGAPEFLVDFVGGGLKIVPRFFTQFPVWSKVILTLITINVAGLVIISFNNHLWLRKMFFCFSLYLVALLPVIFLPWHKFTLELAFPLFGFCLGLAILIEGQKNQLLKIMFITCFISLNLASNLLNYQTNFIVPRSKISKNVSNYIDRNYPKDPKKYYFEFINEISSSNEWGVSKQIAQSISYSDLFRVKYRDVNIKVYFEDIPEERPIDKQPIKLKSLQFLR